MPASAEVPRPAGPAGGRALPRGARAAALAVLVLSFLVLVLQALPIGGSTDDLVRDVRAGRTSTVYLDAFNGDVVAEWQVLPLVYVRHTYVSALPGSEQGVAAFQALVRDRLGPGHTVRFRSFDDSAGPGGLSLFAFALYPLWIQVIWLRWAVLALGAALLLVMLAGGTRRGTSGVAWLWTSVLTGFGFFAWLWMEPTPLLLRRRPVPAAATPVRARAMWGASALAAYVLAVLGALVHAAATVLYT